MRIILIAVAISILSALPLLIEELFMSEVDMSAAGIIFSIGQLIAAILCLPRFLDAVRRH